MGGGAGRHFLGDKGALPLPCSLLVPLSLFLPSFFPLPSLSPILLLRCPFPVPQGLASCTGRKDSLQMSITCEFSVRSHYGREYKRLFLSSSHPLFLIKFLLCLATVTAEGALHCCSASVGALQIAFLNPLPLWSFFILLCTTS